MTMLTMVVAGIFVLRRRIQEDEVEILAIYGDAYAGYMRERRHSECMVKRPSETIRLSSETRSRRV